ncbi:MAG: phosphoglucosamine mutase [Deltaproteobacteria bacterium]|nr:phosphoglucosamine mutase [Deltaproteobacteria bacterium]
MGKLFGTDGIRGLANTYPMTPEIALKAGRASVAYFRKHQGIAHPKIVVGRDTRISGPMLESAIMAGICSMGGEAVRVGVIPTPGVAYVARTIGADAGIVISASHNPYEDNGIKFFKGDGYKLSDAEESELEALILDSEMLLRAEKINAVGRIYPLTDAARTYQQFLGGIMEDAANFKGIQLVIDCSNGATSGIAPELFASLGFDVISLSSTPNGTNINADCGSQHPEKMAEAVVKKNAEIGLAFDGDGDRLIAVDEKGVVLTGDQIIAICALFLDRHKQLNNRTVVSTVMSNIGLGTALRKQGIRHVMSDVGDRYVMTEMLNSGAVVGGEDSGHIIFHDHHTTGDGMLAALQLIKVMTATGKSLSELAKVMTVSPQVLINVPVKTKPDIGTIPEIQTIIRSVENDLNEKGRVLVRYSGTQSMCRVMVEAPTEKDAGLWAQQIAEVIAEKIG